MRVLHALILGDAALAMILGSGCAKTGGQEPSRDSLSPVAPTAPIVATYGHVVTVRYANHQAYEDVQKALFWRGQADPAYAAEALTEQKRLHYILAIDQTAEYRNDADISINEEEARRALQQEYENVQRMKQGASAEDHRNRVDGLMPVPR